MKSVKLKSESEGTRSVGENVGEHGASNLRTDLEFIKMLYRD